MGCLNQEGATLMAHTDATSQTVAIKASSWAISFSNWNFKGVVQMFLCKVGDWVASWGIWPDVFV